MAQLPVDVVADEKEPLQKVTLNLVVGDKETLADFHPAMGWSVAARRIIHNYCAKLRERDSQEVRQHPVTLDVDLLGDLGK